MHYTMDALIIIGHQVENNDGESVERKEKERAASGKEFPIETRVQMNIAIVHTRQLNSDH